MVEYEEQIAEKRRIFVLVLLSNSKNKTDMKPRIICHMMSSVDGRLLAERWSEPFQKDKESMYEPYFEVRADLKGKASIIGRNTVQKDFNVGTFNYLNYSPAKEFKTFIGKADWSFSHIIFDSKGIISYHSDNLEGYGIIAVLGECVSEEYLTTLREKNISYLFAGKDGNDIEKALETLYREFGFDILLLEGGGTLNGSFLKAGLIDELSVLIYPGLDGLSGEPSIIDYKGNENELPAKGQKAEFLSVELLSDGIVWIRYKIHKH